MSTALYNEIEPYPAQWTRNLIDAGLIAPGTVDERSITDITPADLQGVTQFHAFAGIAGWSLALRLAGIPDDFPVWTGSCPCQPFSSAGKRGGFADERHLWPDWFRLIRECRPAIVLGEQVASRDGLAWFDAVSADLESAGYAVGAANLCAAGVGAPHIRQRLYFVAHANGGNASARIKQRGGEQRQQQADRRSCNVVDPAAVGRERSGHPRQGESGPANASRPTDRLGNARRPRPQGRWRPVQVDGEGRREAARRHGATAGGHDDGSVGDSDGLATGPEHRRLLGAQAEVGGRTSPHGLGDAGRSPWADLEWLACTDGQARPTQPGLHPLAHGVPGRMGRLRAYGNAIVPPLAAAFITAALTTTGE